MFKIKIYRALAEDIEETREFASEEEREKFVWQVTSEEPGLIFMLYGQGSEPGHEIQKEVA